MTTPRRKSAHLEPPRETVFPRTYSAMIRSDGSLLPIEERLGRRLLRTLAPDSLKGRELLRKDCVKLVTDDGRPLAGLSIEDVYARLRARVTVRLAVNPRDPDRRRHCKDTLATIERWRRALSRDH